MTVFLHGYGVQLSEVPDGQNLLKELQLARRTALIDRNVTRHFSRFFLAVIRLKSHVARLDAESGHFFDTGSKAFELALSESELLVLSVLMAFNQGVKQCLDEFRIVGLGDELSKLDEFRRELFDSDKFWNFLWKGRNSSIHGTYDLSFTRSLSMNEGVGPTIAKHTFYLTVSGNGQRSSKRRDGIESLQESSEGKRSIVPAIFRVADQVGQLYTLARQLSERPIDESIEFITEKRIELFGPISDQGSIPAIYDGEERIFDFFTSIKSNYTPLNELFALGSFWHERT